MSQTMTNQTIPTLAEQSELAAAVLAHVGPTVTLDGCRFKVVRYSNELRFLEEHPRNGAPARSAHVQILRADLALAAVLPQEYQDATLATHCTTIVRATLGAL